MTTPKLVAALVVAAVLGGVVATTWIAPAVEKKTAPDGEVTASPKTPADAESRSPTEARVGRQADDVGGKHARARTDSSLDDLRPTDEERAWLRTALTAERQRRVDAVIRPDDAGTDVLRRYLQHQADVEPVLASFEAARAHVRSPTAAALRYEAPDEKGSADLSGAMTAPVIEFGPGRFDLRERHQQRSFFDRRTPIESLEIRGAGKDKTTLVLGRGQEFRLTKEAKHVVLLDLTIENPEADSTPFDVRGTGALAFERVRFAGWAGGGYGAPLGIGGQAFLACRECDFQGDGGGSVVSMRGPSLAVFERCTFADVYSFCLARSATRGDRPSVVRLVDCAFAGSRLTDSRSVRETVDLRVRGGRVAFGTADIDDAERRQRWGAEFAASVESVSFAADVPPVTCSEFARVLDIAAVQGWDSIVHAVPMRSGRRSPRRVDLYVASRTGVDRRVLDFVDGTLREVDNPRSGRESVYARSLDDVAGLLALRTLLSGQSDVAAAEFKEITYRREMVNDEERWVCMLSSGSSGRRLIDATTGEVIER
jgi:hypothetical protein